VTNTQQQETSPKIQGKNRVSKISKVWTWRFLDQKIAFNRWWRGQKMSARARSDTFSHAHTQKKQKFDDKFLYSGHHLTVS
jgi:hypothetical protein